MKKTTVWLPLSVIDNINGEIKSVTELTDDVYRVLWNGAPKIVKTISQFVYTILRAKINKMTLLEDTLIILISQVSQTETAYVI